MLFFDMGTQPKGRYTMSNILLTSALIVCIAAAGWNWREDITKLLRKNKTTHVSTQISPKSKISQHKPEINDPSDSQNTGENMSNIITTPSGLSYIVLKSPQDGAASPQTGQKVSVHYTGWLLEHDESNPFDSSVQRGRPFEFIVGIGQVIKGWDEAVLSMKVGEKRQITLPPSLGYGSRGAPGAIPGNATLVFNVELLAIK